MNDEQLMPDVDETVVEYQKKAAYWKRQTPRFIGDIKQRPSVVEMLGDVKDKHILEAGCGTGYVARMIASKGARVTGCDREKNMLELAVMEEKDTPLGIQYDLADIAKTPYGKESFDGICSVGVLIHSSPKEFSDFLNESYRLLKPNGVLAISIEHPFLFTPYSPTRNEKDCWASHQPLDDFDYLKNSRFNETYVDVDGSKFNSVIWYHPLSFVIDSAIQSKFNVLEIREPLVEKEDLISSKWGDKYGYPGFLQVKLGKM